MDIFEQGKRKQLYSILILVGILLLSSGILLGTLLSKQKGKEERTTQIDTPAFTAAPVSEATAQNLIQQSDAAQAQNKNSDGAEATNDATQIIWEDSFTDCAHVLQKEGDMLEGYTPKTLQESFPAYTIKSFSPERVVLSQVHSGYCPAHYLLVIADGALVVTKRSEETMQNQQLMQLPIDAEDIPIELKTELEKGVVFDALAQIDEYIENIES